MVPWLAIRNQSFVTNKDKCYKRPPPPLANRPLPRHPSTRCTASTPLTESHSHPPTAVQSRCADIKRQIKIRCYLSKLWTGSNSCNSLSLYIYIHVQQYCLLHCRAVTINVILYKMIIDIICAYVYKLSCQGVRPITNVRRSKNHFYWLFYVYYKCNSYYR